MNSWKYQDARKHQCPRCKMWITVLPDMPGRPDMLVWRGGRIAAIEVKNGEDRFEFSRFEAEKREYAAKYCHAEPFCVQYWLWLALGTDPPHRDRERFNPRRTWLIPLEVFYEVEAKLLPHQKSLPYRAGKGSRNEVQKLKLDAIHLLADFELQYKQGDGLWLVPPKHPFRQLYLDVAPLPMYKDLAHGS